MMHYLPSASVNTTCLFNPIHPGGVFYPEESFLKIYSPGRNFRHRGDFMQRFNEMYRGASGGGGEMGRGAAVGGREGDVDEDDDGRR